MQLRSRTSRTRRAGTLTRRHVPFVDRYRIDAPALRLKFDVHPKTTRATRTSRNCNDGDDETHVNQISVDIVQVDVVAHTSTLRSRTRPSMSSAHGRPVRDALRVVAIIAATVGVRTVLAEDKAARS